MNTREYRITYVREGDGVIGFAHNLVGYADANFTGHWDDRKLTTGWVFTYNGSPMSQISNKKQGIFSRLTMESEVMAGSFATMEGIWLIRLGKDFQHNFTPIPIFTDNQFSITFSNDSISSSRTKHIDVHYMRNQITTGNIKLHYIKTFENPANILMKPLSPCKHLHILEILGVCWA